MFCKSYAFALASALVLTSMHRKDRHTHPHPPFPGRAPARGVRSLDQ